MALGFWIRKELSALNGAKMGHTSGNMTDGSESNVNCDNTAQDLSEGKNTSNWPGGHSGKNVVAFRPCPKSLPEAKLKSFRLKATSEDCTDYIDSVVGYWYSLLCRSTTKMSKRHNEQ